MLQLCYSYVTVMLQFVIGLIDRFYVKRKAHFLKHTRTVKPAVDVCLFVQCSFNTLLRATSFSASNPHAFLTRKIYRTLIVKTEANRHVEKSKSRWENIKMDHREADWESMKWIYLALLLKAS